MRSKLFGRLMSFTLSATVALTSGIPSLAFDGGGGELPDDEEILELEEEEFELEDAGSDFGFEEADEISFEEDEEFESWDDIDLRFKEGTNVTMYSAYDGDAQTTINDDELASAFRKVDSDNEWSFYVEADPGYALAEKPVTITYYDWSDKTAEEWTSTTPTLTTVDTPGSETYTVSAATNGTEWTKITLSSALLSKIKAGMSTKDGTLKVTVKNADQSNGLQIAQVKAANGVAGTVPITIDGIRAYEGQINIISGQKVSVGAASEWEYDLAGAVKGTADPATLKTVDNTKVKVFYGVGSTYAEAAAAAAPNAIVAVDEDDNGEHDEAGDASEWWMDSTTTSKVVLGTSVATNAVTRFGSKARIFIILDQAVVTPTTTEYFTVTVYNNASKGFVTVNEGTTVDTATEKVWDKTNNCANLDYVFGTKVLAAGGGGTRTLKTVEYSVDGGKTKVTLTGVTAPASDATDGITDEHNDKKFTIPKASITGKNLTIYLTTTETIKGVKGTGYETIAKFDGTSSNDATVITGSDVKYIIRPLKDYTISEAGYKIGASSTINPFTVTSDGTYEGTLSNIRDTVTFVVTTTALIDGTKQKVSLSDASGAGEISGTTYLHYDVKDVDSATPVAITTTAAELAPLGKPFLFTVAPKAAAYTIKDVSYSMKDASGNAGAFVPVTAISNNNGTLTFKTAKVTGDIAIKVGDVLEATVLAPANKNVTMAGVETSATAATDADYAFSIATVASDNTISIRKDGVKYTYGGTTVTATKNSAGQYIIKKADLQAATLGSNNIQVVVETDELVTSGYYTEWQDGIDTYTYAANTSNDYGDRADNHIQNVRDANGKITSQSLNLSMYEEVAAANVVTVTFDTDAITKGSKGTLATTAGTQFSKENGKLKAAGGTMAYTASKTGTEDDFTVNATTGAITLTKVIDNATLTATYTITGRDKNGDAMADNNLIYQASIPVKVFPHYESYRIAATPATGASYSGDMDALTAAEIVGNKKGAAVYSYFNVVGKLARTGEEQLVDIDTEVTEIKWATSPEYNDDDLTKSFKLYKGDTQAAAYAKESIANVNVAGLKTGSFTIYASVKGQKGKTIAGSDATVKTPDKSFEIVADDAYHIYPTVEVVGGKKDTYAADSDDLGQNVTNAKFELEAHGNLNTAKISYKIYKVKSGATIAVTNEATLAAAIKAGDLIPFTPDKVSVEIENLVGIGGSSSTDTEARIKATENSLGEFTITALSKPTTASDIQQVTLKAMVNKVAVTDAIVNFSVVNTMAKKNVVFELANELDYTVGGTQASPTYTLKAFDLAASYKQGKGEVSTIEAAADDASWAGDADEGIAATTLKEKGVQTGVRFTQISDNQTITLPTAAEVVGDKGSKWVLAGWKSGSKYYAPGETVVITKAGEYDAADKFVAQWKKQYAIDGIYNANIYTVASDGTKTYTAKMAQGSDYTVSAESNIPVLLAVKTYDGMLTDAAKTADSALPTAQQKYSGKVAGDDLWSVNYLSSGFTLEQATAGILVDAALKAENSGLADRKALDTDLVIDGYANGSTKIKAAYTTGGATYKYVTGNNIVVDGVHSLKIKTENVTNFVNKTIYVGTADTDIAATPVVDNVDVADASVTNQFAWNWISKNTSVVTVKANTTAGSLNHAYLTAVAPGTAELELTITDSNGKIAKASVTVTVLASEVEWTLKNDKTDVTAEPFIDVLANDDSPADDPTHAGVINVSVDGVAGTLTVAPKVAADADNDYSKLITATTATVSGKKADGSYDVTVYSGKKWGTTTVTLTYTTTSDSRAYTKDVTVNVYKTVTFSNEPEAGTGTDEGAGNGIPTIIPKDANHNVLVSVNGVAQTVSDTNKASKPVLVKVYKDQITKNASDVDELNFALSGFTAQYYDETTATEEKVDKTASFVGWNISGEKLSDAKKDKLNILSELDDDDGTEVDVELVAYLNTTPITNLTVRDPQTKVITLSDEVTTATATTTKPETTSKVVKIGVEPYNTTSPVTVTASAINIFTLASGAANGTPAAYNYASPTAFSASDGKLVLTAATPQGTNRVDSFTVGMVEGKAGQVKLTVSGGNAQDQEIIVNINGVTKSGATITGYYEDGKLLKGEYRTVAGNDIFFDETTGAPITTGGIYTTKDKEGKVTKVLLIAGTPATRSTLSGRVSDTENGVINWYFLNNKSEIQTGWLDKDGKAADAATGVYYADPETGILATSKLVILDEKAYYFNKSSELAKASAAADKFEKVENFYVDAEGNVAIGGIFTVAGIARLFREDGTIVSYSDSDVNEEGIITVDETEYVISQEDNSAEENKFFEVDGDPTWTWQVAEKKVVSATAVFKSKDDRTKTVIVPVADMEVKVEDEEEQISSYKAVATFKSKGQDISAEKTAYFNAEGEEVTDVEPFEKAGEPTWEWKVENKAVVSATATFKSTKDKEKVVVVPVADMTVTVEDEEEGIKGYTAVAKFTSFGTEVSDTSTKFYDKDGKEVTDLTPVSITAQDWQWKKSDDGKSYASVDVKFTLSNGKEKTFTILATDNDTNAAAYMTKTDKTDYTEYVAYASFKSFGQTVAASDTKLLDPEGNEYVPHEGAHKYVETWGTWTAVADDPESKTITLDIVCKEGGKEHAAQHFEGTFKATKNGTTWYWVATFKSADGQVFTNVSDVEFKREDGQEVPVKDISGGELYIVGIDDEYGYGFTGQGIQPTFQVMELRENEEGVYEYWLVKDVDYTVKFKNNKAVNYSNKEQKYTGNPALINITGKGNYSGKATSAEFKIYDPKEEWEEKDLANLKNAKLALSEKSFVFNGDYQYPATITLTRKGQSAETYTWDADQWTYVADGQPLPYPIAVSNNRNKGTAKVTILGAGGTKATASFKITAAKLTADNIKVKVNGEETGAEAIWSQNGATPWVEVTMKVGSGDDAREVYLTEGEDYKVVYKNNKAVGTGSINIVGKGNCTKTVKGAGSFTITALDLAEFGWVQGIKAAEKTKVNKVGMTIVDTQCGVINPKNYTVVVTDADGNAVSGKLEAGKEYLVKATAKTANLTGETEARPITIAVDLGKAKISGQKNVKKTFTGDAIVLTEDDMKNIAVTLKVNGVKKTLVYGEDFEIAGYANNVKKGSMTVTIEGKGDPEGPAGAAISGTKTFKIKITAKTLGASKQ